ncbi:MAG: MBL fold metallo-hydrolase [Dehalococcoidia bacterium]|nr:MBL fold metallo-hydrolase [Dehalococcoidia bacterium]
MTDATTRIGNVTITALVDTRTKGPCTLLFPGVPAEAWEAHRAHLIDDPPNVPITITSYLVRSSGKTVLVDTGIGAKDRSLARNGRLPEALTEAGVRPDEIDIVLATHMHIDHVGWHTTAVGEAFLPTFPKARHVFHRREWEHWTPTDVAHAPGNEHIVDCVLPLEETAAIELVDGEQALTDELTLLPTPGHTPGHVAVAIASAGEAGVIIGDVCHHPAQMVETGWTPLFDANPLLASGSRAALMQKIEDERLLVAAGHFAHPGFGRLVRVDGRRSWRAL